MEHDLQEKIAQLVLQLAMGAALDRVGNLIGFLDRVGRDRAEILFQIPGAAAIRIAQFRHDGEQAVDRGEIGRWRGHVGSVAAVAGIERDASP